MMKRLCLCFFFVALCASTCAALPALTTGDGLAVTFGGSGATADAAAISALSVSGAEVSGTSPPAVGGFRATWHGEDISGTTGPELLENGDFALNSTSAWRGGWVWDATGGRGGGGAAKLTPANYAYQTLTFAANASVSGLKIGGWARAENVNGERDSDYSVYVDIRYSDGTNFYGRIASFETGTHDYQYSSILVQLEKPILRLSCYLLLRGDHTIGTAWFDDVSITTYTPPTFTAGTLVQLSTSAYQQTTSLYGSSLEVNYTAAYDHVRVNGRLRNTKSPLGNRAITLSFSLPIAATDAWTWGSALETERLGNFSGGKSHFICRPAMNDHDRIPLAAVSSDSVGIAIGAVMETYYPFRFSYNGFTQLLTIDMDFALTSSASDANSARFSFVFFKLDKPTAKWPWRSGWDKYCKQVFVEPFMNRVIRNQGLWMPFDKISSVTGWEDFGFAFYEGSSELAWLEQNGIYSFPYIEPPITHLSFEATSTESFQTQLAACNSEDCNVTKDCFITNGTGSIIWFPENAAWNVGVKVPVNSNPGVPGSPNRCDQLLDDVDRLFAYAASRPCNVSGIYLDSLEAYAVTLSYRAEHFKYSSSTPFFDTSLNPVMMHDINTFDFARVHANEIRTNRAPAKYVMANGVLIYMPHFALYIDVFGTETGWLREGVYSPMSHDNMFFRRALSFTKPYCFLQNSDFTVWTKAMTEAYMQSSLLYGIWPGFFSADAAGDTYFSQPDLYNRDRQLFTHYIPIFKEITSSGWEPITCAAVGSVEDTTPHVERWGSSFPFLFTVRVDSDSEPVAATTMSIDLECLGVSSTQPITVTEIAQNCGAIGGSSSFNFRFGTGTTYTFRVTDEQYIEPSDDSGDDASAAPFLAASALTLFVATALLL